MSELKSVSSVKDAENFSEEIPEELMSAYKQELAHIYKMASAKRALLIKRKVPNLKMALDECSRDMRGDIEELKRKYGIHY